MKYVLYITNNRFYVSISGVRYYIVGKNAPQKGKDGGEDIKFGDAVSKCPQTCLWYL